MTSKDTVTYIYQARSISVIVRTRDGQTQKNMSKNNTLLCFFADAQGG